MSANNIRRASDLPRWLLWLSAGLIVVALVVVMAKSWPLGADYYYTFRPIGEKWLSGETRLYDEHSRGFFNPPWTLVLLVPLAMLPIQLGQAVLNVASLIVIVLSIHVFRGHKPVPVYAVILAVANLHTFDLLIRGQLDAFVLAGVALSWYAIRDRRPLWLSLGFWLMSIKPQNVVLVTLLFLLAIRKWSLPEQAKAFSLPVLSLLGAGFFVGFDWPLRYLNNYAGYYESYTHLTITLWRGASQLGLPVWPIAILTVLALIALLTLVSRTGVNNWLLNIALATNLLFTLYAIGNHYVLLIPVFIFVAREDWRLALLAYLATWTPLLRLFWGYDVSTLDILYPLTLFVAAWSVGLRSGQGLGSFVPVLGKHISLI